MIPARAARRQLLVDRFAEYLTERGATDEQATAYAADLRDIVDELGFALPAVLEDTPSPPPPPRIGRTPAHEQAMAEIRAALDPHRHDRRPAFGASA